MAKITDKEAQKIKDGLCDKPKMVWDNLSAGDEAKMERLAEDYKAFLDASRTERQAAAWLARQAEAAGFGPSQKGAGRLLIAHRRKAVALAWSGQRPLEEGLRIIGSHIDCPRLDFKTNPLYEEGELVFLKSHYYGYPVRHQWLARPLALVGVVVKSDGRPVEIEIGLKGDDPVFIIDELPPHLSVSTKRYEKKLSEYVEAEKLNLILGSRPLGSSKIEERFKLNVLKLLKDRYDLGETDFKTAELEAVPAERARDVGLDGSLIGGYGHDDRGGSFLAFRAAIEAKNPLRPGVAIFVDKEEIFSVGNVAARSNLLQRIVGLLLTAAGQKPSAWAVQEILANSKALSTEMVPAFDPEYPEVHDRRNAAKLGYGPALLKYSGTEGKVNCNDANAEYLGWLRQVFDRAKIIWQTGHNGQVDKGGYNSIAMFLADHDLEVVDLCLPCLCMHSPMELISKADLFMGLKAISAFIQAD